MKLLSKIIKVYHNIFFRFYFGIALSSLICFFLIKNIYHAHNIILVKFLVTLSGFTFFYYSAFSLIDIGIEKIYSFHIKYNNDNINKKPIFSFTRHKNTISFSLKLCVFLFYIYMIFNSIILGY